MEQKTPGVRVGADPGRRVERPLGRGLEDISHLFLSQRPAPMRDEDQPVPAAPPAEPAVAPTPPPTPAPTRSGVIVHQSHATLTRHQLAGLLKEPGVFEEGLRGLDASVPCPPGGEIDILALDRANVLTVVDYDVTAADALLLRGLSHVDWILRHVHMVRRMYTGQVINFSAPPRVVLMAPEFSALLKSVARQISRPQITVLRYHLLDVAGGPGLFFERLTEDLLETHA